MTDESVAISITIKVEDVVMEIQEKGSIGAVEESVHRLATGLGQQALQEVIHVLDDRIAREVPAGGRGFLKRRSHRTVFDVAQVSAGKYILSESCKYGLL
jgi:hypothetical protein